eukprot:1137901-Rhodomonas_salina.1
MKPEGPLRGRTSAQILSSQLKTKNQQEFPGKLHKQVKQAPPRSRTTAGTTANTISPAGPVPVP